VNSIVPGLVIQVVRLHDGEHLSLMESGEQICCRLAMPAWRGGGGWFLVAYQGHRRCPEADSPFHGLVQHRAQSRASGARVRKARVAGGLRGPARLL